ncbi:hypothetical protein EDC56_1567 [Sinobacterium caligoides]|uniref:Tetratricopeptide repeat protein n=1 Tax=Sinobacterium caligoides TaxID=933926 RepID=A0A3N2DNA6_9GAMM|nr:hypothetical protein [Sinobacterium caligoides]ROS01139.1 hypothetical protein EDC56_1567 [Sinobacterium caligoides]
MIVFKPRSGAFLSLLLLLLLSGCVAQHRSNDLAEDLQQGDVYNVLHELEKDSPANRDYAQYQLNLGLLQSYVGDFAESVESLQKAKRVIAELQAISVSENIGAVTVNEAVRSYDSTPSERMLLQQLLIVDYLMLGDIGAARVEVLQANVIEKSLPQHDSISGWVASTQYLSGLVYELNREPDNAMISYRRAYKVHQRNHLPVPKALSDSLLYMTSQLGLRDEHRRYQKAFGYRLAARDRGKASLTVLYWGEVVSHKEQRSLSVFVPDLRENIALALPYYRDHYPRTPSLVIDIAGRRTQTQPLDDVEKLVRADLSTESKAIYARAMARMVAKHMAIQHAQRQDDSGIAAAILNIATTVSEQADVRSWNMLPATIQVARLEVPPGRYDIELRGRQLVLSKPGGVPRWDAVSGAPAKVSRAQRQQQTQSQYGMQQRAQGQQGMQQRAQGQQGMQQRAQGQQSQQQVPRPPTPEVQMLKKYATVDLEAGKTSLLFCPSVAQQIYSYKEP